MTSYRIRVSALALCLSLLPLSAAAQPTPQPQQGGDLGQADRSQPLGETTNAVQVDVYDQNHCRHIRVTQTYTFNQYRCRWHDEDVTRFFLDPNFHGFTLRSSQLTVDYSDADLHSVGATQPPELDVVQFGEPVNASHAPTRATLGVLTGWNRTAQTFTANVKQEMSDNSTYSAPFVLNIDAAHSQNYWCLNLAQVKLVSTYNNCIQPESEEQHDRAVPPSAKEICLDLTKQQSFSGLKLPPPVCK